MLKKLIYILIIFFFSACSKPPMQEIINARSDIKAAYSAGASIHAPSVYYNAELALKKAEMNLNEKKYNKSRNQAKTTIKLAKKARELSIDHVSGLKSKVSGEITAVKKIFENFIKNNSEEYTKIQKIRDKLNKAYDAFSREDYILARKKVFEIVTLCRVGEYYKKSKKELPAFYKVKRGDCLINIAKNKEIFNNPWLWPLIYRANRDQIRNPHYIYVGQKLFIPRNIRPENISSTGREAKSLIKNQE